VTMYRDKMLTAIRHKDYDTAVKYAESALNINFLNIEAHIVLHQAQLALGNNHKADKHRFIADSLLNTVLNSGDGQSARTAFKVISVQEEYAIISAWGARTVKQVLVNDGEGKFYDVHEIIRPGSTEKEQIFFDVSTPYETLRRSFGKDKAETKTISRVKSFIKDVFKG
jgi:hypothetical protein